MSERVPDVELPRPAPDADRGPLDDRLYDLVEARVRRLLVDNPTLATYLGIHTEDHRLGDAEPRRRAGRDRRGSDAPRGRRGARRRPGSPRRPGSSGTSRSTTCAWRCSTPTRSAAGSGGRRRRASSATRCSCCSPAARRRSRSGSSGSPTGSRPRRRSSSRRRPARPARRSRSGSGPRRATRRTCPSLFAEVRAAAEGVLDGPALARLDRSIAGASAALEAYGGWVRQTHRTPGPTTGRWAAERYDELVAAAGVRGPGRGRDPPDRPGPAPGEPRGPARRRRARSTPTPTCRASSSASRPTARRRSSRRSTATARSWAGRAPTSSSTAS